jgi:hypothetical protein
LLVTVLLVILLIWAVNELIMPQPPMPEGVPSIIRRAARSEPENA